MRPNAKHIRHVPEKVAREIRQGYVQRYLKQFLRRVHPDLFQHYPKEQAQNSASLQELLPLVGHDKQKQANNHLHTAANQSNEFPITTTRLSFYFKPNTSATEENVRPLRLVEHNLSLPHVSPASEPYHNALVNMPELEQELKSWEMVQSFMELCTKVGVPVSETDRQHILERCQELLDIVEEAKAASSSMLYRPTEKSLQEIFAEELQGSFAGSSGITASRGSFGEAQAQKVKGSSGVEEQARRMIESNPLLFKSAELSDARLEKTVRKWLHWQEEDRQRMFREQLQQQQQTQAVASTASSNRDIIRLEDWWRKVPLYVAESNEERRRIQQEMQRQGRGGMVVVAQETTKEEMTEYLSQHLQAAREQHQAQVVRQQQSDDASGAQYLARMQAKHRTMGQGPRWGRFKRGSS